jgi:hypothetical protein
MFQIKENPPFLFTFSFSFPTGMLNLQRTFICQIHFHLKKRYLLATLFLLSHSRRISQIIRGLAYAYNLCSVLKWEKTLSIFRFFIMFLLNSLSVCLFHVHGLPTVCALKCPHYIVQLLSAAIAHSCCMPPKPLPTLPLSSTRHGYCKNWQSSSSAAIVF